MASNPANNGLTMPGSSGQLPPSSSSSSAAPSTSKQQPPQQQQQQPRSSSARQLSCTLCQRRKIKCDRTIPCSNCVKANVVCTPSKPAPPRQRTRPRQDLQERLAKCESLLRQYAEADRPVPGNELVSPKPTTASGASTPSNGAAHGVNAAASATSAGVGGTSQLSLKTFPSQLQDGPGRAHRSPASTPGGRIISEGSIDGETRFIDGQLWELLNDEITSMKRLIEAEDSEVYIPPYDHKRDFEDTSNCPSPSSDEKPELDPVQSFKLWQVFLDRVNPLIKIVHAPTLQPYLVQAAADISAVPLDYQGLLYSVFGLACIALTDSEALAILGCAKEPAAHRFTKGTFRALTRFDFLRRYNMVVLQALVHTLIILQSQYNRHASWVLSGSLVRIAISMGYHRDGSTLKLSPFETEIRRRIWWQIVTYDLKLTVDCGLKHQSIPIDFDTKQPLNLNDADMYPDAAGELKSREGPTEMAFVLVSNRLTLYMLDEESRLTVESTILGQGTPETALDTRAMERNRTLVNSLEQDLLEIERRFLSPTAGNAHVAALGVRAPIISRLNEMMRPMTEAAEWGTEIFGPKDNLLKLLIGTSENIGNAYSKAQELGFSWYVHLHFHLEIMASIASFLHQRPFGEFAERGWRVLRQVYDEFPELFSLNSRAHATQAQFTLKAWDSREQAWHNSGQMLQVPEFIIQLRQVVQQHSTPSGGSNAAARTAGSTGQGDVRMSTPQTQPLTFAPEEPMGLNQIHSSFLTWDFLGNMGGGASDMNGMGDGTFPGAFKDYGGAFEDYGGPNPFQ